jgi:uncharacterized RDD family membrane protein YckC
LSSARLARAHAPATTRTAPPVAPQALDTLRQVATPEGIELTLRLAGPIPRALAWSLDFLLRLGALVAIAIVASPLHRFGTAILLISWFALEWLFPAWCEVYWRGATPGKRAMGLAVVHDDGRPVRWPAALTRNLLRFVDFLPMLYGFGLVAMLLGHDFKRLGDLAAGTVVVHRDRAEVVRAIPAAEPIAPRQPLWPTEQRAILEFAERLPSLTPDRADELAAIPRTLVGDARDPVKALAGIANHLSGKRESPE